MIEALDRPELALAAALAVALLWVALAFWLRLRPVGDDLGARLDAMAVEHVTEVAPADRYDRFATRDYSGDRGPLPTPRKTYASIYDELCDRLGVRPC